MAGSVAALDALLIALALLAAAGHEIPALAGAALATGPFSGSPSNAATTRPDARAIPKHSTS